MFFNRKFLSNFIYRRKRIFKKKSYSSFLRLAVNRCMYWNEKRKIATRCENFSSAIYLFVAFLVLKSFFVESIWIVRNQRNVRFDQQTRWNNVDRQIVSVEPQSFQTRAKSDFLRNSTDLLWKIKFFSSELFALNSEIDRDEKISAGFFSDETFPPVFVGILQIRDQPTFLDLNMFLLTRLSFRFSSSICESSIWSAISVIWFEERSINCKLASFKIDAGIVVKLLLLKWICLRLVNWLNETGNERSWFWFSWMFSSFFNCPKQSGNSAETKRKIESNRSIDRSSLFSYRFGYFWDSNFSAEPLNWSRSESFAIHYRWTTMFADSKGKVRDLSKLFDSK